MSQLRKLALHLGRGKSITPMEAKQVYGIERLAARVYDLNGLWHSPLLMVEAERRVDEAGRRYTSYWASWSKARKVLRAYAKA
jgi:hypothetical protein